MPTAAVTVRELKNRETGIDLNIPSHKETPGLLGTTVEYHVVVVSNLQCFKSTTHKDNDVVQFMIPKLLDDFEDLKKKLNGKYQGTVFPKLPGKGFTVLGDSHAKERRLALEKFLSFIASTPKLAQCQVTLEFLGVNSITAANFSPGEGGTAGQNVTSPMSDIFEDDKFKVLSPQEDLFGEGDEDDLDLFKGFSNKPQGGATEQGRLFDATVSPSEPSGVQIFAKQDYGGAISKAEAEKDLFVVTTDEPQQSKDSPDDDEDHSDLFNIEDDLDKLLEVKPKLRPAVPDKLDVKPNIPDKPNIQSKPDIPQKPKPKPPLETKPKPLPGKPQLAAKPGQKPSLAPKPTQKPPISAKPKERKVPPGGKQEVPYDGPNEEEDLFMSIRDPKNIAFSPDDDDLFKPLQSKSQTTKDISSPSDDLFALPTDNTKTSSDLQTDDIFKYIQDNAEKKQDDLDLFS